MSTIWFALGPVGHAQTQPPAGSPTDVRYTPIQGTPSTLYPKTAAEGSAPSVAATGLGSRVDLAANAAVGRLVVEVDRDAIPADGQSPARVVIRVFGRDGRPLNQIAYVTVEHSGGRILVPGAATDEFGPKRVDVDKVLPGTQLKVEGGVAEFTLLAPIEAQDVRLRVTAGSEEASGVVTYVAELRPMIAAGLIEGIVNFRGRTQLNDAHDGDGFEREINYWSRQFNDGRTNVAARTAFFLKGTVKGDVLLTAAYDSDKDTRSRLLRDINPDSFYPVYGDSSLRSFDARSVSRVYLRLDQNRNYVLYGDFVTGDGFTQPIGQGSVASLKQRSLGNYNRTATGLRLHDESDRLVANLFAFRDSLRQVVEEFASQGSGPYGLRNNAVLEGSEKVEVITRDRNQPSRIVAVRPLGRLVDYSFEPFSGRILLFAFLPAVDENLNPVSLRVTYEVDQGGPKFWVYGGDAQYRVTDFLELGGSAAVDTNDLSPYRLYSANATLRLGPKTVIVAEVAQTQSDVNTNPTNVSSTSALANRSGELTGRAWRIELAHEDERTEVRGFFGRSAAEFNNPSSPLDAGRGEAELKASYALTQRLKVYGEAVQSEDRTSGGGERKLGGAGLRWAATDRLTFDVGMRFARETIGTQGNGVSSVPFGSTLGLSGSIATGSGGGALGYGNQSIDPVTGLPVIRAGGLAAAVSDLPAGTHLSSNSLRVGVGLRVTDNLTLGAQAEHEVSGDDRRRYSVGGDLRLTERSKLYARYERQSGWTNLLGVTTSGDHANAFVVGIDTNVVRDTQVFSEYRLRDAISGKDLVLASGVRNVFDLAEGIRVSSALEHIDVMSGQTPAANAISVGVDYAANELWRGTTRLEVRRSGDIAATAGTDEKFTTTLWQVMVARKLARDWTLLGRNYLLHTDYADRGDITQDRAQVGVAYRDTDTNRVNALAKIEYKLETDASNPVVGELQSKAIIASAHADWHPVRPWWMTGRIAAKWQRDVFEFGTRDSFRATLVSGRVIYDIAERWDLGAMLATQVGQQRARQYAAGAEVGYLIKTNLWLSGGYNYAGFSGDSDLVGYEYTRRGVYLRLRFKFDETLFSARDPAVNPTLSRNP